MKVDVSPESFWKAYSKELNREEGKKERYDRYHEREGWTPVALTIAKETMTRLGCGGKGYPHWVTQTEYYKVDMVGYLTNTGDPDNLDHQHDWWLNIAYEHENATRDWHDELCKLCFVAADLRVLASYHDFSNKKKPLEPLLTRRIERLGKERMFRVCNGQWLFIFGPSQDYDHAFRAYTLSLDLKLIPVESGEKVIPGKWKTGK